MNRRVSPLAVAVLVPTFAIVGAAPLGCGSSSGKATPLDGSVGDSAIDGPGLSDDGGLNLGDVSTLSATALTITVPTPTLLVTDATTPPSESLTATLTMSDGSTKVATASWTLNRLDIADVVAGTGVLTPTAATGGIVTVTATASGLTATAKVTVNLALTIDETALSEPVADADRASLLAATTADPAITSLLYPYDQTVFPIGLAGPEVMWNGGAAGDAYLLKVHGPFIDYDVFAHLNPPGILAIDDATWDTITATATSSGTTGDLTIELRHLVSSTGTTPATATIVGGATGDATWHIANANLRGSIYYWAVNQGQVLKIKPGAKAPANFFPAGPSATLGTPVPLDSAAAPSPPWQDNGSGNTRCIACHSVSRDGSRLSASFSTPRGSVGPAGFVDLTTSTVNAIGDYQQNARFTALTPNGMKAVVTTTDGIVQLLDATSGAPIASALDGAAQPGTHPTFAADGTKLAYATTPAVTDGVDFDQASLTLYDFTDATNTFANVRTLVASTGPNDAIAYPSFSPDSQWIFFQRGDYGRAKYGTNQHGNDNIYVVSTTAGSTPISLNALNGVGVLTGDNVDLNYQPTVNPIAEGGYFWVVFVTNRDYGNQMVSPQGPAPADASYSNLKQLWVAAVDGDMKAIDPSHPAFRLPGQLLTTINMSGYWTLEACKPTPTDGTVASCSAGFECCSGFCRDVAGEGPACVSPPTGCHETGEACTTASDCCGTSATCTGGFCTPTTPH